MKATVKQAVEIPLVGQSAIFHTFNHLVDGLEHLAIVFGPTKNNQPPLVRIHSECLTGDVFGSARCDCGDQLHQAMHELSTQGGVLLYLRQEGRGIGLYAKIEAYALQLRGLDTYEANRKLGLGEDLRNYESAAQMLRALGVQKIRLLTNNPDKRDQLEIYGVQVAQIVQTQVFLKEENRKYLEAKIEKTGHLIDLLSSAS